MDFADMPENVESLGLGLKLIDDNVVSVGLQDAFMNLKTNEERFGFVWNLRNVQHALSQLKPSYKCKSHSKALEYRNKGNKFYKDNNRENNLKALKAYNNSILYAPLDDHNQLSLAYSNRSAALFRLGKFTLSLIDTEKALKHGYPDHLKYKLYNRRGQCFKNLKQKSDALESFVSAEEYLHKANVSGRPLEVEKQTICSQVKECQAMADETPSSSSQTEERQEPLSLTEEKNDTFPKASVAVSVKYAKEKGRCVVAAKDIAIGDAIIRDESYASMLDSPYYSSLCYHCYSKPIAPVPCPKCSTVIYCDQQCQQQSWDSHHRFECSYFDILINTHLLMLSKIAAVTGCQKILQYWKDVKSGQVVHSTDKAKIGCNSAGVYDGSYHSLCHLATFKENILFYTGYVVIFVKILQLTGFLEASNTQKTNADRGDMPDEDIAIIGGALLSHLMAVRCNIFHFCLTDEEERTLTGDIDSMGMSYGVSTSGVYTMMSLLNHSCDPNVTLIPYGTTIVVRALCNISKGEEITMSYGPMFQRNSYEERQTHLKDNYEFDCKCKACVKNWPILDMTFPDTFFECYLCCQHCHEELIMTELMELLGLDLTSSQESINCVHCGKPYLSVDVKGIVSKLDGLIEYILKHMDANGNLSLPIAELREIYSTLWKYVQYPCCIMILLKHNIWESYMREACFIPLSH